MIPALFAVVATLATGLFAGAALYVSLVEHPARVACGPAVALRQFRPSYRRGAVMQVILALVGTAAAVARFASGGHWGWLGGGVLLFSAIPFTLVFIMPTNKRLLDESLAPSSAEAPVLLARWGRLHAVRSAVSLAAFGIFAARLFLPWKRTPREGPWQP